MHHSFENVLFWQYTLHVFNQLVCLINLVILKVVNYEIKAGFWNDIYKRG